SSLVGGTGEPRREPELRPAADLALDPDIAVHDRDELFDDRQTEAGPAARPGHRGVDLVEGIEDPRLLLRIDADPGIANRAMERRILCRAVGERHLDQDLAALGELDGV